jgi:hypothetical protein
LPPVPPERTPQPDVDVRETPCRAGDLAPPVGRRMVVRCPAEGCDHAALIDQRRYFSHLRDWPREGVSTRFRCICGGGRPASNTPGTAMPLKGPSIPPCWRCGSDRMNYVKRERWPVTWWRARSHTIGQIIDQAWFIWSVCRRCYLVMEADLAILEHTLGERETLWNQQPPCRRFGCKGLTTFHGVRPETNQASN